MSVNPTAPITTGAQSRVLPAVSLAITRDLTQDLLKARTVLGQMVTQQQHLPQNLPLQTELSQGLLAQNTPDNAGINATSDVANADTASANLPNAVAQNFQGLGTPTSQATLPAGASVTVANGNVQVNDPSGTGAANGKLDTIGNKLAEDLGGNTNVASATLNIGDDGGTSLAATGANGNQTSTNVSLGGSSGNLLANAVTSTEDNLKTQTPTDPTTATA